MTNYPTEGQMQKVYSAAGPDSTTLPIPGCCRLSEIPVKRDLVRLRPSHIKKQVQWAGGVGRIAHWRKSDIGPWGYWMLHRAWAHALLFFLRRRLEQIASSPNKWSSVSGPASGTE